MVSIWYGHMHVVSTKFKKAIFNIKVAIKVTRSFALMSLERPFKWSMHAKYEVSISYG